MFKIGHFARIVDVSVHTLRHYDDIGLFQPQHIDNQTGYRYYSAEQLPRFHHILALRELGLSLGDIKTMLDDDIDDASIRALLIDKQNEIQREMAEQSQRLLRIQARLHQLDHDNQQDTYQIVVKSVPALWYLSTGAITVTDEDVVSIMDDAYRHLAPQHAITADNSLILVHDSPTPEGLLCIELGYTLTQPMPERIILNSGRALCMRRLDAISTMATTIHVQSRFHNQYAYCALYEWIDAHGYQVADHQQPREIYVRAGQHQDDGNNIVEIQIPLMPQS